MLVAGWSLTKACNLKCLHCYSSSGKRDPEELTTTEALEVADKLKQQGVVAVNFGGGECALRPDFLDICQKLYSLGMAISYTTNGTTFERIKEHLHLFHDIGVSIDFADASKHDAFRGKEGTFHQAIEALEVLVEKGINNEMVTCLTKQNCSDNELKQLYELAQSLNLDSWRLNRFRANGRGEENRSELALSPEDLRKAYTFLSQYHGKEVLTPEPLFRAAFGGAYFIPGDPSGKTAFRIQPNGEVSPSVFLSESGGNIKYQSLGDIFHSEIFQKIQYRKPQGKCQSCEAYSHCQGGDAGASYLAYGHFNGPDPLCWLNPEDKKAEAKVSWNKEWNVHELYLCTLYIPIKEKTLPKLIC